MPNPKSMIRFLLRRPNALRSRTARWAVLALAATGAAFLVWSAVIHLELWGDGYSAISVIGPLFLAQGIGCIVLGTAIVAFRSLALLAAGAVAGAATAVGLLLDRPRRAVRLHREPLGPLRHAVPRGRVHRRLPPAPRHRAARPRRARPGRGQAGASAFVRLRYGEAETVGASGGPEHDDMTCAHVHDVAAELALGALTGRERAIAIAHLERCRVCREDVRQLMATGGQLLELLPHATPPAGFETRVLERLGMPASPEGQSEPRPLLRAQDEHRQRRRGPPRDGGRPCRDRPPIATGAAPDGSRPPGRVRRALAATAMGLAVIAAGLGGWRLAVGASPSSSAAARLASASLLSATRGSVGNERSSTRARPVGCTWTSTWDQATTR